MKNRPIRLLRAEVRSARHAPLVTVQYFYEGTELPATARVTHLIEV